MYIYKYIQYFANKIYIRSTRHFLNQIWERRQIANILDPILFSCTVCKFFRIGIEMYIYFAAIKRVNRALISSALYKIRIWVMEWIRNTRGNRSRIIKQLFIQKTSIFSGGKNTIKMKLNIGTLGLKYLIF